MVTLILSQIVYYDNIIISLHSLIMQISLPFQLISIVGWLLCFGGFVWSHFKGLSEVYGQPVSEILFPPFAFLLGTPIFHIIYSLYVLTDLWILGLFVSLIQYYNIQL